MLFLKWWINLFYFIACCDYVESTTCGRMCSKWGLFGFSWKMILIQNMLTLIKMVGRRMRAIGVKRPWRYHTTWWNASYPFVVKNPHLNLALVLVMFIHQWHALSVAPYSTGPLLFSTIFFRTFHYQFFVQRLRSNLWT